MAVGQNGRKLLTSVACDGIHRAYALGQCAPHRLQDQVTGMVTVGVVHVLEMVDIEHQQQCGITGTGHDVDRALHDVAEVAPVGQTRQRVLEPELAQAVYNALQVGG
ncbi:MAG: hypothetical protein BWZ07_03258 [Alphaproteobacteria bacterium ADurb.BinA280]|nr:MAG: hypothetical protein BWZ07_03258 [Alphaproteobacteria bacterium ADurb.BinA280]